jgi:hypothetical protein
MIPPPPTRTVKIQPNPTFQDEKEMLEWLQNNIPGAKVIRTWKVEKLACEVLAPEPKAKIPTKKIK